MQAKTGNHFILMCFDWLGCCQCWSGC